MKVMKCSECGERLHSDPDESNMMICICGLGYDKYDLEDAEREDRNRKRREAYKKRRRLIMVLERKCPKCGAEMVVCVTCGAVYKHDAEHEWCEVCHAKNDENEPGTLECYGCDGVVCNGMVIDMEHGVEWPYKMKTKGGFFV